MRFVAGLMLATALWAPASFAQASIYTDQLSRCLVKSATPEQRSDLVLYIFAAMGQNEAVQPYLKIDKAQGKAISKGAAQLMERLLTVDCRTETIAAIRQDGAEAFGTAFGVLGEVAMTDLLADPAVTTWLGLLEDEIDPTALNALGDEAGVNDTKK